MKASNLYENLLPIYRSIDHILYRLISVKVTMIFFSLQNGCPYIKMFLKSKCVVMTGRVQKEVEWNSNHTWHWMIGTQYCELIKLKHGYTVWSFTTSPEVRLDYNSLVFNL